MLFLVIFYLIFPASIVASKADLTAILYTSDLVDDISFSIKTAVMKYAEKFNYSVELHPFERVQNTSHCDFSLVDAIEMDGWDPNPFVLTAIVPFYSIKMC